MDASGVPGSAIPSSESVQLVWGNIFRFIFLHLSALYGALLLVTGMMMWQTVVWSLLWVSITEVGITAGAHRYWSHRSFKAKTPLRLILAFMQTSASENSIYDWCRDHRLHHKFTESHADPHNAKRGFFFAHMGWLLCRKHKEVKEKGKLIDMSDLKADRIVMFQKKHYVPLVITASLVIPVLFPWVIWKENLSAAWFANQLRYIYLLHVTWLVNSAAHLWGPRPYDKEINPAENSIVAILTFGEGWHNFHHVFPWDYKAGEFGRYRSNFTTAFIDFFAWIGWAYELKAVSTDVITQRLRRTGDGSHEQAVYEPKPGYPDLDGDYWGWGDKDILAEDIAVTDILHSANKRNINSLPP